MASHPARLENRRSPAGYNSLGKRDLRKPGGVEIPERHVAQFLRRHVDALFLAGFRIRNRSRHFRDEPILLVGGVAEGVLVGPALTSATTVGDGVLAGTEKCAFVKVA